MEEERNQTQFFPPTHFQKVADKPDGSFTLIDENNNLRVDVPFLLDIFITSQMIYLASAHAL